MVPMLRGLIGTNIVATPLRLLITSGRPIEPHQAIPRTLEFPQEFKRWMWPKLLTCMVEPLGLRTEHLQLQDAEAVLQVARSDGEADTDDEGDRDDDFKPNAGGFKVVLADGTDTRLRFRTTGPVENQGPELRTANRNLPIKDGMDLKSMAKRVLERFKESHELLEWEEDARLAFRGFQTVFDCQCAQYRNNHNQEKAVQYGASPWLLGMLSAALYVMEVAAGDDSVKVRVDHVVKAFDC